MNWKYEPYKYKYKRCKSSLWFWNSFFEIIFEDTVIRIVHDHETAENVVCLLNAAWNLGYAQGTGTVATLE